MNPFSNMFADPRVASGLFVKAFEEWFEINFKQSILLVVEDALPDIATHVNLRWFRIDEDIIQPEDLELKGKRDREH